MEPIKLLPPKKELNMDLMKAINERKSKKDYTPKKELTLQQISDILYCAYGINDQSSGHRTVSSGMSIYPLELYVVLPKGIYFYEAKEHLLKPLKEGDYMEKTGRQPFVKGASMTILFYSNTENKCKTPIQEQYYGSTPQKDKDVWADIEVGFACQNIYLYCTAEKIKTCVRAWCDGDYFKKELGLPDNYRFVLCQSMGL